MLPGLAELLPEPGHLQVPAGLRRGDSAAAVAAAAAGQGGGLVWGVGQVEQTQLVHAHQRYLERTIVVVIFLGGVIGCTWCRTVLPVSQIHGQILLGKKLFNKKQEKAAFS